MKENFLPGEIKLEYPSFRIMAGCLFLLLSLFATPALSAQKCNDAMISSTPESGFLVHNDGTVLQKKTGLMWMRCSAGQAWDGKTCSGAATGFSWAEALHAAAEETFAGYDDWRLPNKNELDAIVEERCASPAINSVIFPATPGDYFWSSSPYSGLSAGAWSVDFGFGVVTATEKVGILHVRLVRDVTINDR